MSLPPPEERYMSKTNRKDRMVVATVLQLKDNGIGYLCEQDSSRTYVFTFDKIQDYKGENIDQLGLRIGAVVRVTLAGKRVARVQLTNPDEPEGKVAAAAG